MQARLHEPFRLVYQGLSCFLQGDQCAHAESGSFRITGGTGRFAGAGGSGSYTGQRHCSATTCPINDRLHTFTLTLYPDLFDRLADIAGLRWRSHILDWREQGGRRAGNPLGREGPTRGCPYASSASYRPNISGKWWSDGCSFG